MTIDYIVSSLPALEFGSAPQLTMEQFAEITGGEALKMPKRWLDLDAQLRNALVEARGGEAKYFRPSDTLSLYWKNRVLACFQEKSVMRREELLDRVWWDAAGELIDITSPLGKGSLYAYAIRLKIAIKRASLSKEKGEKVLEAVTSEAEVKL